MLRDNLDVKEAELSELKEQTTLKINEANDASERLERQRDVLRPNGQELVEAQSKAADLEERLIQTEQHLINAKSSWAESEHEKEMLLGKLQALDEILRS